MGNENSDPNFCGGSEVGETLAFEFWNRPDVVILANVPDIPMTLVKKLEDFVLNGGGLLVTFGDQLDPTILNRQLAKLLPLPLLVSEQRPLAPGDVLTEGSAQLQSDSLLLRAHLLQPRNSPF